MFKSRVLFLNTIDIRNTIAQLKQSNEPKQNEKQITKLTFRT